MQTFLPYPDLKQSAEALRGDRQRLGKQRVETLQLIQFISGTRGASGKQGLSRGWQFHPASRMWAMDDGKYLLGLLKYQEETIKVWVSKGYRDECWEKSRACFSDEDLNRYDRGEYQLPPWFGDSAFHLSHQARLVQKWPEHYGPMFPDADPTTLPEETYIWPGPTLDEARAALGLPPSKTKKKKSAGVILNPPSAFERVQITDADSEADLIQEAVEADLQPQPVHL